VTPVPASVQGHDATTPLLTAGRDGAPEHAGRAWPVLAGLAALAVGHLAVDCFTAIWPVYKTISGLDITRAGMIATAAGLLGSGLQVAFGVLADRGLAKVLLIGGVLLAGAVALLPCASSYGVFFALVATTSIGSAAFHPTGTGVAGALSSTRTGVFVALFLAGGYVGYGISQLVFTSIHRATGGATVVLLPISVVAALAIARFVRTPAARSISLSAWLGGLRAAAGRLGLLFLVQIFASTISVSLVFLLPDLLLEGGAPRWMVEGGGHLALVCGSGLALVPAGYASDSLGPRRVLLLTNLASGLLLLAVLRGGLGPSSLLTLLAVFGACNSCNSVIVISEGNRLMPGQASGASALLMGLPWCFSSLAPVIAGSLADHSRGGTPSGALRWMALCVPITLSLCLLLPGVRRPRYRRTSSNSRR
jgi:hypothetical protein